MLKSIVIKRFMPAFMTSPPITLTFAAISLTALSLMALPSLADTYMDTEINSNTEEVDLNDIVRNPIVGNYKGYAEFKMGHYGNARTIWEALENKGNAQASFNLGILYEDGLGVTPDYQQAIHHYEKAAHAGSSKAQYRLGLLYSTGIKTPKNDTKADKWLAAAAAQGDDDAAALLLHRQPAAKPSISPVTSNRDKAFFNAENRHAAGQYKEAAAIWQELSNAGDTRSRTRLAWMHEAGQGMPRDLAKAATLFKQSAEEGDAEAQYSLAVMLQTGQGQAKNIVAAQAWLQRAAAQGYPLAKEALSLD